MKKKGALPFLLGLGGLVFMPALARAEDQPGNDPAAAAESGPRSMQTVTKQGESATTRVQPPAADQPGKATLTKTEANGQVSEAKSLTIPPGSTTTITMRAPSVVPKRVPIYFETDSAKIEKISMPLLDATAAALKGNPQFETVSLEGHADARGSDAHNVNLTDRRAQAVSEALQQRGVPADRLESHGLGSSQPICSSNEEDCWSQNRRVDIVPGEAPSGESGGSDSGSAQ